MRGKTAARAALTRQPTAIPWVCLLAALLPLAAIALEWEEGAGHRRAQLAAAAGERDGFAEMPATAAGIHFRNRLRDSTSITNQIYLNGSGVAAADVDGDDLCDLYFCGLESRNALYRNLDDWQFEDITMASGTACADQPSTGAAFADIDGDGDSDLLVNGIRRGTRLFLNNGNGVFREYTEASGLSNTLGSTSMSLADVDGNGWLDLYVVNYRNATMRDTPDAQFDIRINKGIYELVAYNGRPAASPDLINRFSFDQKNGILENGQADRLFRNNGKGSFAPVAWNSNAFLNHQGQPAPPPYDWGLSAILRDLNGDFWPDLYVCNDFQSPDRIWINDGKGCFRPILESAIQQTSLFSMGVDVADINRDGRDDIFVADMLSREHAARQVQIMEGTAFAQYRDSQGKRPQSPRNTLLLNRGNGHYAEIARLSGLDASDWSWCPAFLDVDLDGYEDLLITTGHWRDAQNADVSREIDTLIRQRSLSGIARLKLRQRFPRLHTPNAAFRNRGDLTFADASADWGFDSTQISHGMALADLDNDGDQDLVINCLNAAPLLLRNRSPNPRLRVRLKGLPPNTQGIGARITVAAAYLPKQMQELVIGGRYLSSDEPSRVFAANPETNATVHIRWRSGRETTIKNVRANHLYEIIEPDSPPPSAPPPVQSPSAMFRDATADLNHQHTDSPYNDYLQQSLLPRKLSEPGPGVTWFDFNEDGWEDLIIGAGRGGKLGVFRNNRQGKFVRQRAQAFATALPRDHGTILGWKPNDQDTVLLIGETNYEDARPNATALKQFSVRDGTVLRNLLRSDESCGPLAMADVDNDGDLDLFVGSSHKAGHYPTSPSSHLLLNQAGRLVPDAEASQPFSKLGMIRSAIFTDLNADAAPDLVLAGDWMPIRFFRNHGGKFQPWNPPIRHHENEQISPPSHLDDLVGWWNSISAGDFDADGRLDLVAGNWGRNISGNHLPIQKNAPREKTARLRRRLYFESRNTTETRLLEAYRDPKLGAWFPKRDWATLGAAFPSLLDRYRSYTAFGKAQISDIFAADFPPMQLIEATILDSIIFLNRGDAFETRSLPIEAQFAPVFGLDTGDINSDGHIDIVLTQNTWALATPDSRQDAGGILLLLGQGDGNFQVVPPKTSGLSAHGQGRGLALCDYDHDGRLDFAAAQNNGPTRLYRNQTKRSGLRIQLKGTPNNRAAIGAQVRLNFAGNRHGPIHEIRSGNGYWSQNTSALILGSTPPPASIHIRWPNGIAEQIPLPLNTREIKRTAPLE